MASLKAFSLTLLALVACEKNETPTAKPPAARVTWPVDIVSRAGADCFELGRTTGKLFPSESGVKRDYQSYGELEKYLRACECLAQGLAQVGVVEVTAFSDFYVSTFWATYREAADEYLRKDPPILSNCKAAAGLR